MTDFFGVGAIAWGDDATLSQTAATPDATRPGTPDTALLLRSDRRSAPSVAAVAGVAEGAETEGQRLERALLRPLSQSRATPAATTDATVSRGVEDVDTRPVAGVASVANWRAGVDRLRRMRGRVRPYHADSWRELIADADGFLNLWGEDAVAMGWSTLDVFGTNPNPWQRRYDRLGLVVLLAGRPIQSLEPGSALIGQGRDTNTYRRRPRSAGAVALWDISEEADSG